MNKIINFFVMCISFALMALCFDNGLDAITLWEFLIYGIGGIISSYVFAYFLGINNGWIMLERGED